MLLTPTVIAIPIFALLIGLEAYYSQRRRVDAYEAKDAWTNILIGFVSVATGAIFGLFIGGIYLFAYELAPYKFPADAWWTWALLFFIDDFAYYWFHRISHESRLFWNFHVVHHSSEQYNLSVAVRQSWFSGILHWVFYAPIMLLGFAPWMFAVMHGFNLIYQFWIHTKLVGRMGPLEWVLNTPSHHRVHHGVNNPYLDRNYAGVLIIWDRLFGSFVDESEEPRYGIIKPIKSYNPLWINTHAWYEMFAALRERETFGEKLRCVFGSPNIDKAKTKNMKYISPVALVLALCISAAAQVVTIESKEEVYTRPKPIQDFKKQFTVTRPIAKTSDRARAKKITEAISPEAMLDFDVEREMDEVQWVEETGYDVLYNDRGVLAIRLWMYGSAAYPDDVSRTTVIDLSTGDPAFPEKVFTDLEGLAKMINAAQKREIAAAIEEMKADPDNSDLDPDELFGRYDFSADNITEYSVDDDGVTFYYDYYFPHVAKALEPEGKYTFTWEEMKPFIRRDGLLARFIS